MVGRGASSRRWPIVVCSVFWLHAVVALVVGLVFEFRFHDVGRSDLTTPLVVAAVVAAATLSAGVVGTALVLRRTEHPVGWLFLGLSFALSTTLNLVDSYARWGAVGRPGSLAGADVAAFVSDRGFVAWFAIVSVILHLTPTGRPLTARWGRAAQATVAAGAVSFVSGMFSTESADPPFSEVENPLVLDGVGPLLAVVWQLATAATALGLLTGAASLVVRFRRSTGTERRQLLWLALVAAPLPISVAVVFVASRGADNEVALVLGSAGWIVLVPISTGLCITRYHLFEVDRILSRTFTYSLLTATLVLTYGSVVVLSGRALSGRAGSSTISAVLATLAAVSAAAPARRFIQDALDRRFNRRRFDALRIVEAHMRNPSRREAIDDVLRRALGDPVLEVAYWIDDRRQWVSADGQGARPGAGSFPVERGGHTIARLTYDESRVDPLLLDAVAAVALPELDNTRLRSAIAMQLVEVNESRSRIAAAQLEERRKIERNLHDGAQQRLLALGFQLRAAQLNGSSEQLEAVVAAAIEEAQAALVDLRDLANGLHPAVLSDGGLSAALDDLAARNPVPLDVHCPDSRFAPDVEAAAWFVVCEAVANACKHGAPDRVSINLGVLGGALTVEVRDDGVGGADPHGSGLQGIRDRAEALGGSLEVESCQGQGTTVRARIPCAQ